jgi:hypothetical protein
VSDDVVSLTGRTGPVRVDVSPSVVPVASGAVATLAIEITNNDSVIRSMRISVLGLDEAWVSIPERDVALFPAERREVVISLRPPDDFPSGARRAAVEVRDSLGDLVPALVEFDLLVDPVEQFTIALDPTSVIVGGRASFTATLRNNGNTPLEVELAGSDPELILRTTFVPSTVLVYPNTVAVARVEVQGRRPRVGNPQMRLLTVTGTSGPTTMQATAAVMQRPWVSRRILTLLGLLTAITVFTLVLAATFGNLARRANDNAELIKQSLGGNDPASSGAAPAQVTGAVTSSTGLELSGVTVDLFDVSKGPSVAASTTVTDDAGGFSFASVTPGTYRVRFSAAGFAEVWFPTAAAFEQAEDVVIEPGTPRTGIEVQLIGQSASVTGSVQGGDVVGATVVVRLPGDEFEPVPGVPTVGPQAGPVVQTVAVDAAGRFTVLGLPTPRTFELLAVKSGYTSRVRSISLEPGQQLTDIVLDLVRGDGVLTGTVVDPTGAPVGGASVVATDGANTVSTVTISSGTTAGSFELRNLITPATYSISVSAPGFVPQTVTVRFDSAGSVPPLTIGLRSSVGTVSGMVLRAGSPATPFGGVTVTVTGPDFVRSTRSLTEGDVGSWRITGLPLPGTYTVAFSYPGYITEARGVELSSTTPINTTTGATLTTSLATVFGQVTETGGAPAPGVQVIVSGPGVTRTTRTAVDPAGGFELSGLPPGAYSITFRRTGSRDVVVARNLVAGVNNAGSSVIEPVAGIYGTVTIGGVPTAGVTLRIYVAAQYPNNPITVLSGVDGKFELVIDVGTEQSYIVDVVLNNVPVASLPVIVGPGAPATGVDFIL